MKKLKYRANCILLIGIMFFSTTINPVFGAAAFTDTTTHWAASYINTAAEKGIIIGYPDGTYKPDGKVTKEESITMIYRILKANGVILEGTDFSAEYQTILSENHISSWANLYISYCLKNQIIMESELSTFIDSNLSPVLASREQVAIWIGRAIKATEAPAYILNFGDTATIMAEALPFVDLLYRNGIMIGDQQGNFRPQSTVTRGEFATICTRVLTLKIDSNFTAVEDISSSEGIINYVDTAKRNIYMTVENQNKQILIGKETEIFLNAHAVSIDKIVPLAGTRCIISYANLDEQQITIWTTEEILSGSIQSISSLENKYYSLAVCGSDNGIIFYIITPESEIYDGDNNIISPASLKKGQSIKFITDGVNLLEVGLD